jgi:5-methylcytosine-specific restriction endonuclease McrBC regulatory subunit McrC
MTALDQQLLDLLEKQQQEQQKEREQLEKERKELYSYLAQQHNFLAQINTQNNEIATLLQGLIEVFGEEQEREQRHSSLEEFQALLETSLSKFQIGLVESLKQVLRP